MKSFKALLVLFIVLFISTDVFVFGNSDLLKSNELEGKVVDAGYLLQESPNDMEILFFGYVGCGSVCPQLLYTLSNLVNQLNCEFNEKKVGAVFADIASIESMIPADYYARSISPVIKGINLSSDDVNRVHRDFGVTAQHMGRNHVEINQKDHFFVLERIGNKESDTWMINSIWPGRVDVDQMKKSLLAY